MQNSPMPIGKATRYGLLEGSKLSDLYGMGLSKPMVNVHPQ